MRSLILGTAQWGLDYGITNATGRISDSDLKAMLARARNIGIDRLDTAADYGDAESRVTRFASDFKVQTKVEMCRFDREIAMRGIEASLERLNRLSVESCLIHDWPMLCEGDIKHSRQALAHAKDLGLVERVGISAYSVEDLRRALKDFPELEVVQIPLSILDQRLVGSPEIDELRKGGVEIQARSVFLQGVTLGARHNPFADHPDVVRLVDSGADLLTLSLGFVWAQAWVDAILIAPTTERQIMEIINALSSCDFAGDWSAFASSDESLLDPRTWR